jgi:hypothetical protein
MHMASNSIDGVVAAAVAVDTPWSAACQHNLHLLDRRILEDSSIDTFDIAAVAAV